MTQVFDDKGAAFAATTVEAAPMTVTQVKTTDKDGYPALQVGIGSRKKKNVSKPVLGHTKGNAFRYLREMQLEAGSQQPVAGEKIDISIFSPGDVVAVWRGKCGLPLQPTRAVDGHSRVPGVSARRL